MRPVRTVVEVNDGTGEVTKMTTVYVSPPQREPPYVKIYFEGFPELRGLPPYCWPVLVWLMRLMPYANAADPCFEFGAPMRKRAAQELGMSVTRINHAVSDLLKAQALLRAEKGLYRFNPSFFARGEWRDIKKLRSLEQKPAQERG